MKNLSRRKFMKGAVVCAVPAICAALLLSSKQTKETFKCLRCGRCCRELVGKKMWVGGKLTWEQKQQLLKERKKYPPNDKGCEMLYFNNKKLATCLVYKMFGSEARDQNCIDYPKIECLNGQKRNG